MPMKTTHSNLLSNQEFTLSSPAYQKDGGIPSQFTCEGENISPPLMWSHAPKGTLSYALIIDDPDAPDPAAAVRTWVHWVLYNIPAHILSLPQALKITDLPLGAQAGLNDWHHQEYGGPCPPIGRHRYFHKLYALDIILPDFSKPPTKAELEKEMLDHMLGQTTLIGTYQKINASKN